MKTELTADVWIGQEDSDEYWAEGVKARLEVEVTDEDEIRLGVQLDAESSDVVSIYISRAGADKLARYLAAATVAEIEALTRVE